MGVYNEGFDKGKGKMTNPKSFSETNPDGQGPFWGMTAGGKDPDDPQNMLPWAHKVIRASQLSSQPKTFKLKPAGRVELSLKGPKQKTHVVETVQPVQQVLVQQPNVLI